MSAGQSRGLDYRNGTLGAELLRRFNVRKGSPAEDAGLRRGDEIKYINNNHTYNLSINEIYEFFYRKPGRKIKLGIIRDEFNFSVDIYLSDFSTNKDIFK